MNKQEIIDSNISKMEEIENQIMELQNQKDSINTETLKLQRPDVPEHMRGKFIITEDGKTALRVDAIGIRMNALDAREFEGHQIRYSGYGFHKSRNSDIIRISNHECISQFVSDDDMFAGCSTNFKEISETEFYMEMAVAMKELVASIVPEDVYMD